MDNIKLFHACKTGNLEVIRNLLDDRDIDFNIRDRWDSSPLYYACLCGHENVVRFLLENGAICDANTFDGERSIYGALTDSIRNMLVRDYKVISRRVILRREFDEFLRKTLESSEFSDIVFHIGKTEFKLHRCLLSARCKYLDKKLKDKWKNKSNVKLTNKLLTVNAYKVFLRFLYTGIIDFPIEFKENIIEILRRCRFDEQLRDIEAMSITKKSKYHNIQKEYSVSQDFFRLFQNTVLQRSLSNNDSDIIFIVDKRQFYCHRLFICGRSDYFRALVQNHFSESKVNEDGIVIYELHTVNAELFQNFLLFIYTDSTNLTSDNVFDMLILSDQYFVRSLKCFCSSFIEKYLEEFNIIELITIARSMALPKLEKAATNYIANHLEDFLNDENFCKLIIEDAQKVKERQKIDSIEIIDDVRYYLSVSKIKNICLKYEQINVLLNSLNLEA